MITEVEIGGQIYKIGFRSLVFVLRNDVWNLSRNVSPSEVMHRIREENEKASRGVQDA